MLRLVSRAPLRFAALPTPPTLSSARTYALSRFPDRRVGTARTRPPPPPLSPGLKPADVDEHTTREAHASADDSPLWAAAARPPASDPAEGLCRLLMENELLVVTRQIEMMNVFLGFEQTNRYVISSEAGEPLGYIAEEPRGLLATFARQLFRTHRPFRAVVLDTAGTPILWVRRPFAWVNSRMFVQRRADVGAEADGPEPAPASEEEPVLDTFAEVQQVWHPWRRKYDLFLRDTPRRLLTVASEPQPEPDAGAPDGTSFSQFAAVDAGLLAWTFALAGARGERLAGVARQFRGFGREVFTDTGQYFVRFGPDAPNPNTPREAEEEVIAPPRALTLDERALTLALAVNVDFDYFSRHSSHGGGGMMMWGGGSWGE